MSSSKAKDISTQYGRALSCCGTVCLGDKRTTTGLPSMFYCSRWERMLDDPNEQLSGGSVVVVHEEPHPQMTGTLSYRPEETGGRQREKSLDTRHRTTDIAFYRGQKTARWWSVCTTPCTVCTFNACPSEKAFSVVPGTPELERQ
ncbi:hypothetical protein TNCV_1179751 [Trichonephila clavipes]|nr:hypothetical protein TNCV_1179751 [Trichonephila clavipes]